MVKAHGVAKVDGQVVAEASLMFSIVKNKRKVGRSKEID